MKLLFDQNISFRIEKPINVYFPDSRQVKNLGLENASDIDIWHYARKHGYVITTFDADFADFALLRGCPPKIIWLRTGNMTTDNIVEVLVSNFIIISRFIREIELEEVACLEIGG